MKSLLCLTSMIGVCMLGLVTSESATAKGRILCNGTPMKYVQVSLKDSDNLSADDVFGTTRTDSDGYFTVSGYADDDIFSGAPDPYIEVDYYYSGYYGTLDIQDGIIIATTAYDRTNEKSYSSSLDFGSINFNNKKCKTFQNMLTTLIDYKTKTGISPPVAIEVDLDSVINGGTPYSTTDTIHVPTGYINYFGGDYLDLTSCKHEFAHIIRHYYDGSYAHFLSDVASYWYLRNHDCTLQTNYGFAFNEGWAEYWANSCLSSTGTDYTIEGNVATALRKLKTKCLSTELKMVNVLKTYPGSIHSFAEYNNKNYSLYNCKL